MVRNTTTSLFLNAVMFVMIMSSVGGGGSLGVWLKYMHSPKKCLTNIGGATRS